MFESILNLFFPKVCAGCEAFLVQNEKIICTSCRHNIPLTNHCFQLENDMSKRFYGRIPVEFVGAKMFFHKKGIVQKLIFNLKYFGHQEIGTEIGNWFADDLKNVEILKSVDQIIPVPLHKKRFKSRGYNQVTSFGKALSNQLNIEFNPNILVRNVYSESQTKKNLTDRIEANASVFDVTFNSENHNKHFLLIDDVFTTGATLELCAKALLKIPGTKISIACMSMTH